MRKVKFLGLFIILTMMLVLGRLVIFRIRYPGFSFEHHFSMTSILFAMLLPAIFLLFVYSKTHLFKNDE